MLTTAEKYLFMILALIVLVLVIRAVYRIIRTIGRGQGRPDWRNIPKRIPESFIKIITFIPVFRTRLIVSLFHGLIAWGFLYYLVVNLVDLLWGIIPDFHFLGGSKIGNVYRLGADILTITIWIAMAALLVRRGA